MYVYSDNSGPGKHMGLYVVLNASVADYHCSSTNSAGFKVLLHNPIETPNIANYGIALSPGLETRVIILPRFTEASDRLRAIPIQQRQCIFANERRLSYFRLIYEILQFQSLAKCASIFHLFSFPPQIEHIQQ